MSIIADLIKDGLIHVLSVHAEVEGGIFNDKFKDLLQQALALGNSIVPLKEIKNNLVLQGIPVRKYKMELIPGRHSACAV